ncbi:MAG: PqqD family protein [Leptospiraceae bacterium]|nr:PqqD family protein [Leptospiraceae bacterium]
MNQVMQNKAITPETIFKAGQDVSWREVDGQVVCMHLDNGEYFTLNGAAGVVWRSVLDGKNIHETAEQLKETYGIEAERAATDAQNFVRDLLESGLIEPAA